MIYSPTLPFDIVCDIVAQISDHKTLAACSLTFSALRRVAQIRIFHQMTITVGSITPGSIYAINASDLAAFLIANPRIAWSIRSLTIRVLEDVNGASGAPHWPTSESLLTAFPYVQRISIVDVTRSRYRGWWEASGEFAQALRRFLDQDSVRILQVGAPGMEREFEWPKAHDDPSFTFENAGDQDEAATKGLRVLKAAAFRDRPDNLRTIQNIFFRSAISLIHVWLAFPSHSLPCHYFNAPLSLSPLVALKSLGLLFNAETLIRPVVQILDTIPAAVHEPLTLSIFMQRSSFSPVTPERWRQLDDKLIEMLDRQILCTVELQISIFEVGQTFKSAADTLKSVLLGLSERNCVAFRRR